jgi:uncharacterized secreted protein with C-terminal beta-propeller domain
VGIGYYEVARVNFKFGIVLAPLKEDSMKIIKRSLLLSTSLLALVLVGCADDEVVALDWSKPAALTVAADCAQAEELIEQVFITQMVMQIEQNRKTALEEEECRWNCPEPSSTDDTGSSPNYPGNTGDSTDVKSPEYFSETNTQVKDIDEVDTVKTDGKYIYAISRADLVVVKSWPAAETDEVGRITIEGLPTGFFLKDDKAIVFSVSHLYSAVKGVPVREGMPIGDQDEDAVDGDSAPYPSHYYGYNPVSVVSVIDLSDKSNPKVEATHTFDHGAFGGRRIGDKVHFALSRPMDFPFYLWPVPDQDWRYDSRAQPTADTINMAFDKLIQKNVEMIRAKPLTYWLPRIWIGHGNEKASYDDVQILGACEAVHTPNVFSGLNQLSLATLDLETGEVAASTIQGNWGHVYASNNAIYIASSNWDIYRQLPHVDYTGDVQTQIHKFAFNQGGEAQYTASGKVLGHGINQFAFDEHNGNLRVATTDGKGWWSQEDDRESRVTVLQEKEGQLKEIGMVRGLGLGDRISGVRFIGDMGYVITSEPTAPLHVIDLGDPTNPNIAGELKLSGVSSYIHPLEEGFVLTLGKDSDDEGRSVRFRIEILDVTDPANPKSVKRLVIGNWWDAGSSAMGDHKAFNYDRARNLLAIPFTDWVESEHVDGLEFKSVLALFKVSADTIEAVAEIEHKDFFAQHSGHDRCNGFNSDYQVNVDHSVFIEDYVYSFGDLGMLVHDTRDLEKGYVAGLTLLAPEYIPNYYTCSD